MAHYDTIGHGYAQTRREDPRIMRAIEDALGDSRSVANVGAGTGSYEPPDRYVIAVEPSDVMAAQRPLHRVPALRGTAGSLLLRDDSVDAAMSVLSLHHWDDEQDAGLREMQRVARGPVVLLTYDPIVSAEMWLMKDYLTEAAELDLRIFPSMRKLKDQLAGDVKIVDVPIHRDSPDWSLGSFWAHPERVLDEKARSATSGFARHGEGVVDRVVNDVKRDLGSGAWDARHGRLRRLDELDVGLRLVVATPS